MKNLRRMFAIAMLSSLFAISASAGDIHAGRTTMPEETTTNTTDTCGEITRGVQQVLIDIIFSLV